MRFQASIIFLWTLEFRGWRIFVWDYNIFRNLVQLRKADLWTKGKRRTTVGRFVELDQLPLSVGGGSVHESDFQLTKWIFFHSFLLDYLDLTNDGFFLFGTYVSKWVMRAWKIVIHGLSICRWCITANLFRIILFVFGFDDSFKFVLVLGLDIFIDSL